MKPDIHNKDFAGRLALKQRLRGTWKCPIDVFQNGDQIWYSFFFNANEPY